ncbi:MAG: M28 family peptidase [Planctomycetota bacterium]
MHPSSARGQGLCELKWLVFAIAVASSCCCIRAQERSNSQIPDSLVSDLKLLASDELRGRSAVGDSIFVAAEHIAERYRQIGLETNLINKTPFQSVEMVVQPRPTAAKDNWLELTTASGGGFRVELDKGFSPLAIGRAKARIKAPVAWVGYGIRAKEHTYDDYQGVDVVGRIVMMLRKEPAPADPESPFDGARDSRHAAFRSKVENAIQAGAVAVLFVNDQGSVKRDSQALADRIERESKRLQRTQTQLEALPTEAVKTRGRLLASTELIRGSLAELKRERLERQRGVLGIGQAGRSAVTRSRPPRGPIIVGSIGRDIASQILTAASSKPAAKPGMGDSLLASKEREINTTLKPNSTLLNDVQLEINVGTTESTATSPNVIGVLPGRGSLADESVVIGAHYDHVGMGGFGSLAPGTYAVHNGADDNASGTAMLMQIAERAVATLKDRPSHRRLVFIAFTGEERGLLGSKHYVEQPRFPISQTVTMINLDMVGRLKDNDLTVYGTGSSPRFNAMLDDIESQSDIRFTRIETGFGPSDHESFYSAGVPVLFFFTGLHNDYHRPSDDFDKLNLGGMIRITDIVCQVAVRVATALERPSYVKIKGRPVIRRQLTVYLGVSMSGDPAVARRGNGVVLTQVVSESPADVAGLRVGDRLVSYDTTKIDSVDDLMKQLRQNAPGDTVRIGLVRQGENLTIPVRLRAR